MPTVLLIRHGQASFGGEDYDVLSEVGRRQAEIAGAALRALGPKITRVIAGDLRRQLDTAAQLGVGEVEIDSRWNEFESDELLAHHAGTPARLEGSTAPITSRELQDLLDIAFDAWFAAGDDSPCSRSWPEFGADGRAALTAAAAGLGRGETAVAVTSAGVIGSLCGELTAGREGAARAFVRLNRVQVNAAVTKIAIGSRGATLVSMNDHSHLEAVDRSLVTYR